MQPLSAGQIGSLALTLVLGVVAGTLGTVLHRSVPPWGVVLCLALAFVAGVTSRAFAGLAAVGTFALGLVAAVQLLSQGGPGGDFLVPAGEAVGWVWVLGSIVLTILVAVLPGRLFDDRPRPRSAPVAVERDGTDAAP
ncbi:DUF6113 family protein [uncultured Cellulomonas sp.]|uniref:DUF6113 family protein n=1 Tax=uncultured Cellulomonas sp. TaxID=189682 RepID=UPI0028E2C16D|nr:DUF6113 family protein [uncultured Cellulomonas sp.]